MKSKVFNLIVYLIYFYLPVDTLNGILLRNGNISISPFYKASIIILIIFYLMKNGIYAPVKWTLFFIVLFLLHTSMDTFTSIEFSWGLKFLTIVTTFFFFKKLVIEGRLDIIKKLAIISFILIGLNILIGLSGFGYAQYARNDIGTRGLFYAGNEMGVLLLVTSIIILSHSLLKSEVKKYLIFSLLFIFIAGMMTTKTAVLGQVLVVCFLPFIHFFHTKKGFIIRKSSLKLISFGFILLFVGLPYLINYILYEMNLIARLSYWADKVDRTTLFFSGRNLLAVEVLDYWEIHDNFLNNFLGYGYDSLINAAGRSVEIDAIDLFMIFGLLGVIVIYGFFFKELYRGFKLKSENYIFKPYVIFGILFLLVLSCMSGHVLNSGMAGILIGAFIALQYYYKSQEI